jgi:hypothetical protein
MRRIGFAAVLLGICSPAMADQAVLRVPASVARGVVEGSRWGIFIGVESRSDGAVVTVTQTLRPLGSATRWPLADPSACGDRDALVVDRSGGTALPAALPVRKGESALGVVEDVVRFVSQVVEPDEHDAGAQDAASVLRRRRGRCSGRANAAVGLLRELGLPARVVHGVLLAEGSARLHRWGEVWIGDAGWVPFDPGVSVGVVGIRYLPLSSAADGDYSSIGVESLREDGFLSLPVRGGLRVASVEGVTVHCRPAAPGEVVMAVLHAPDGSRWAKQGRGVLRFDGLVAGVYRLSWVGGDRIGRAATLRLGEVREVHVNLASAGG